MKILIVEDDVKLNQLYSTALAMDGHTVISVFDGKEGLVESEKNHYDLIISDVMMKNIDGFTFIKKIRESNNSTHVIMLTAMSQDSDKIEGLNNGADEYLTKPISLKELQARVNAIARRKNLYKKTTISLKNTTLDVNVLELRSVNSVSLSHYEAEILKILMNNSSNIVSSKKIRDSVFDKESDSEMLLFINISYLEDKLKHIGSELIIKGSLLEGYCIV